MGQIGTIRFETQNSGTVDVPVFDTGDSGSSTYEFVRVQTAGGTGFIPVIDPADAAYPYLRVQSQNNGVVAVTDSAGAIPDSVVTRSSDNGTFNSSDNNGIRIETDVEWPEIGGKISSNTSGATRAYVYRVSDGSLLGDTDISGLSSGDTFTIDLNPSIKPADGTDSTKYNFVLDAQGSSFTLGYYDSASFPINSPDGDLRIINGAVGATITSSNTFCLVSAGDVGF